MLRGFYTAANGMITQQRQQEALANNVANANTPGYKEDQVTMRAFPEMLIYQMGGKKTPTLTGFQSSVQRPIGTLNTGVFAQETVPNFIQGAPRQTERLRDLALVDGELPDENGRLFFTVMNEDGDLRYTRNGNFQTDGEGFLTTHEGLYVLDEGGNIIQTSHLDFDVDADGMIRYDDQEIQLNLSYAPNPLDLIKEGTDLFTGDLEDVPADATYEIKQGFLEQSNVDSLRTMTDMMQAYRMFETNQRVLRAYDESMGQAVSEIGRLQ